MIATHKDLEKTKRSLARLEKHMAAYKKGSDTHRELWLRAYRLRGQIFAFEMSARKPAPMAEWPAIHKGLTL